MKNKKLKVIFYIIILTILTLLFRGSYIFIDKCTFFYLKDDTGKLALLYISIVVVVTIIFLFAIKEKKENFKFYVLVPILLFIVGIAGDEKIKRKELFKRNCIIHKAYVYKVGTQKTFSVIYLNYNSKKGTSSISLISHYFKGSKLNVGDSLYFMYAIDCKSLIDFYEPFPTKEQFNQLQNKSYLVNDKIYSEEEFEKFFQKKE